MSWSWLVKLIGVSFLIVFAVVGSLVFWAGEGCEWRRQIVEREERNGPLRIGLMPALLYDRRHKYIAHQTIKCYAEKHGYSFFFVDEDQSINRKPECQRCQSSAPTAPQMQKACWGLCHLPDYDYLLILDADNAVVQPERRIEEFIDDSHHVYLYERALTGEVASGGVLVRHSRYGIQFLEKWQEMMLGENLPNGDNGALMLLLNTWNGVLRPAIAKQCLSFAYHLDELCKRTTSCYPSFVGCVRAGFNGTRSFPNMRLKIFRPFHGLIMDEWILGNKVFADGPIFYHGFKTDEYFKGWFVANRSHPGCWTARVDHIPKDEATMLLAHQDCQLSQNRPIAKGFPTVATCVPDCPVSFDTDNIPEGPWVWDADAGELVLSTNWFECDLKSLPVTVVKTNSRLTIRQREILLKLSIGKRSKITP